MIFLFFQIPPAPPCPDFDASREKLHKLSEGEGTMTKEEFMKMKQELEMYGYLNRNVLKVTSYIQLIHDTFCLCLLGSI